MLQTAMEHSQLESLRPFDIPSHSKPSVVIKQSPAWKEAYFVNEVEEVVKRIRKASIGIEVADLHPSCFNIMTFAEQITLSGLFNDTITVQIGRKYADMIRAKIVQQLEARQCHLLCLFASISKYSNAAVMRLASEVQKVKTLRSPARLSGQRTILMMLKPAEQTNSTVQCGPAENSWSSLKGSIVAALPKQHSSFRIQ